MEIESTINPIKDDREREPLIFRRPEPRDETDRIGREIVRRMIEAGVVEP